MSVRGAGGGGDGQSQTEVRTDFRNHPGILKLRGAPAQTPVKNLIFFLLFFFFSKLAHQSFCVRAAEDSYYIPGALHGSPDDDRAAALFMAGPLTCFVYCLDWTRLFRGISLV